MVFLQIATVFWIYGRITSFICWMCKGLTIWSWKVDLNKVWCIAEKFKWHLNLQGTDINANCIWWWLGFSGGVTWKFKLSYGIETSIWSLPGMCQLWYVLYSTVWYTWSDNKVRELIAVKMLHTSLLKTTVVAFKVLPMGSYAPMPVPSPPFKTILELVLWNGLQSCCCIILDVISVIKMPSFQFFLYLREQKEVIRWIGRVFQHSYLFSS